MHLKTMHISATSKRVTLLCIFVVFVCIAILMELISSIYSTRPSASAVRQWESSLGPILTMGFSDFRGHWQSHDIGVQIFSFGVPAGRDCDAMFDEIANRIPSFRVHVRSPNEMALRRTPVDSDARGFDEYRFVCVPEIHRIYGMFANIDSEMQVHPDLVRKLHEVSVGISE